MPIFDDNNEVYIYFKGYFICVWPLMLIRDSKTVPEFYGMNDMSVCDIFH